MVVMEPGVDVPGVFPGLGVDAMVYQSKAYLKLR